MLARLSAAALHRCFDRPSEQIQTEIDLAVADGQGWGDAENTAHTRQLHDLHAEPQLHAAARDPRSELRRALLAPPVLHDFHSQQQAAAAHVADALETLLEGA